MSEVVTLHLPPSSWRFAGMSKAACGVQLGGDHKATTVRVRFERADEWYKEMSRCAQCLAIPRPAPVRVSKRAPPPERLCGWVDCRKPLTLKQIRNGNAYCSVSCATHEQHKTGKLGVSSLPERPCACGCGATYKPGRSYQKYATKECGTKAQHHPRATRFNRWETHAERHPQTIFIVKLREELDAEGLTGRCLFCPKPLGERQRYLCSRDGPCTSEYRKFWGRGRRCVAKCKAEGRPVEMADAEPTPEEQEAVRSIEAGRLRLACELDSFRAKVVALARDYGLAA